MDHRVVEHPAMAEAVQTWITPRAGREAASDLIKAAIKKAPAGMPFKQVILGDAKLLELVGPAEVALNATNP